MKATLIKLSLMAAFAVAALSMGCVSNEAAAIVIEDNMPPVHYVNNRNDPIEVIQFARTLSSEGRNLDAARIYLDASKRFESVDGKFELDCRKEAVREFWMAGEHRQARRLFDELDNDQDIYRRASEEDKLQRLRLLFEQSDAAKSH